MKCIKLTNINDVPVFSLQIDKISKNKFEACGPFELWENYPDLFDRSIVFLKYRAASIDRTENILSHGVDVWPTDSPIYCDYMEKALEYGGWPKIVMGYDQKCLDKTFREVNADLAESELSTLTEIFPNMEKSVDGKKLWLSRLDLEDPRRSSSYEVAYSFWIPEDPWKALKVVFFINLPEQTIEEMQTACGSIKE